MCCFSNGLHFLQLQNVENVYLCNLFISLAYFYLVLSSPYQLVGESMGRLISLTITFLDDVFYITLTSFLHNLMDKYFFDLKGMNIRAQLKRMLFGDTPPYMLYFIMKVSTCTSNHKNIQMFTFSCIHYTLQILTGCCQS